ncbi:MAG: type VI secretion system baseplate subunit TssK [Sedimenticola sp.]
MALNSKVIWNEGLFLRPQHLQQQMRHVEWVIDERLQVFNNYGWGFRSIKLDEHLLKLGKIGISEASGVFPDGTAFNIPGDDAVPKPLDVPSDLKDAEIFLALPVRRPNGLTVDDAEGDSLTRFISVEDEVRDIETKNGNTAPVQTGQLRLGFLTDQDKRDGYTCLGMTKIVEVRDDKNIVINEKYLATIVDCHTSQLMSSFIRELQGLFHHRGEALAGRVTASGRGGSSEIADFLLLQVVNRYEPLLAHLSLQKGLHPMDFYCTAVMVAGEVSTFTAQNKRPPVFDEYRHEDLWATFKPVMHSLRQSLSMVLEQTAVAIPLQERKFGVRVAPITDRPLLTKAVFVLAVNANIPTEEMLRRFPTQIKIGPVEQIRDLVTRSLPGIRVRPLPVAPRQIPFHSGFAYFELDKSSEYWKQLEQSGGFALHIGGDFPGLEMEFWAIKA